jgi:hypothetical protein
MYADEKRKAVPSTLKTGDQVFMKQERENKLSTTFNPKPLTVFYFNLPPDIGFTLFTPIKGRIDSLTVYIFIKQRHVQTF